jgi:EmrB/QacA subfamily drug resistance transporter
VDSATPAPGADGSRLVTWIVAGAMFMENLDSTVIATSLPLIAADIGRDPIVLKLALTSYLLSLAVFIPVSGWAADRFGARRVFRAAILVFTSASILCGMAHSLQLLVAARILQGAGGALMVPVGRIVLLRAVPKHELVGALAYLTVPALIAPILGPPVGGLIATAFGWEWIFWINVPFGLAGLLLTGCFMPDAGPACRPPPLDWAGFILSGVALSSLSFALTAAGNGLMTKTVFLLLLGAGTACLIAFLERTRRTPHPILDLKLLAVDSYRISVVGGFVFRVGYGALPFLLPLLFQIGFGLSAFVSGCLSLLAAVGALAMKLSARSILARFGFRNVLVVNAVLSSGFTIACVLFDRSTPFALIGIILIGGGFLRSLEFTSVHALTYADVSAEETSRASTLASVAQQLSLSLGVAAGAAALQGARALRGDTVLAIGDFDVAFIVIGVIAAAAALIFRALPAGAGEALCAAPAAAGQAGR